MVEEKIQIDYFTRLRRRVEDRLRKDQEALILCARVLNISGGERRKGPEDHSVVQGT
jgi:hypothetical protein